MHDLRRKGALQKIIHPTFLKKHTLLLIGGKKAVILILRQLLRRNIKGKYCRLKSLILVAHQLVNQRLVPAMHTIKFSQGKSCWLLDMKFIGILITNHFI